MSEKENRSINPNASKRLRKIKKRSISVDALKQGIVEGDRILLSRAITYIESQRPDHREIAQELIEFCMLHVSGQALKIGITGSPGVGKSTFIETLGKQIIDRGHKLAVLAVDPSSQLSKGSILGDKTRMEKLANQDHAFIRPSPAGTTLGGVARKTRETIILCEAAGYDTIFVETVGVGQSEIAVHSMVDCFLLLLLPGAGDDLQGIKRGIVEMADIIIVNKADDERLKLAKASQMAYKNALHLFPPKENNWIPQVMICSALKSKYIEEVWTKILAFKKHNEANGFLQYKRSEQSRYWLQESIDNQLRQLFRSNKAVAVEFAQIEKLVMAGKLSPFTAAERLIRIFLEKP